MEKSLLQLINETEKNTIAYTEHISLNILNELEQLSGLSFGPMKIIAPTAFMMDLLINPYFKNRSLLIHLLEKYQVNERDLLIYLTISFYSDLHEDSKIRQRTVILQSLPYIQSFSKIKIIIK